MTIIFIVQKNLIFFVIIWVLFSTTMLAFAQTEELISVETAKNSYEEGETIVISGQVTTVILDTPVTLQIFHGNTLVEIAQLIVAQDGKYTHTILAQGPLWQKDGMYTVRVSYGASNVVETNFEYFTKQSVTETTNIFEVDAGSSGTFDVDYTIRGAAIKNMIVDSDIFALIVIIESEDDGSITLVLPRFAIDAKISDGTDDTFIILIDGVEVPYEEISTDSISRIITIGFEEGDSDIEIIGTFVIPEFGSIVIPVLVLAILLTIIISTKKRILIASQNGFT